MIYIKIKFFKNNIISYNTSIKDSIRLLHNLKNKIIFVTNKNKLYGSITDNDIRKYYLNLKSLNNENDSISNLSNKKTFFLFKSKIQNYNKRYLEKKINKYKFIPLLDNKKKIIEILTSDNKKNLINKFNDVCVILMAGGLGTRLKPLTNTTPKPIILINKSSNLISLMSNLKKAGIYKYFITTHYLSNLIKHEVKMFWHEESKIEFYNEKKLLGTFGAVIPIIKKYKLKKPIIVCNSDIVTNLDFSNLIEYFFKNKCKFLVCNKILKNHTPYGVIIPKKNNKEIEHFKEKPDEYKLINAGIYMIDPNTLLKYFSKTNTISIVEVISKLLKNKVKCHIFPIKEFWSDMGTHSDLETIRSLGKV